jgi:hypothetical protein
MSDFSNTSIVDLAAIVANHLHQHDIKVVLVGGLAVEIYTENIYLTKDIDMVDISYQSPAVLRAAMTEIGFVKQGRIYINKTTDISVEFPAGPISVGDELITRTTTAKSKLGEIPILCAEDVIKDRLAAYFHWQDKPSLVQALALMLQHPIATDTLRAFCRKEGRQDEFANIQSLRNSARHLKLSGMAEIEKLVIEEAVAKL